MNICLITLVTGEKYIDGFRTRGKKTTVGCLSFPGRERKRGQGGRWRERRREDGEVEVIDVIAVTSREGNGAVLCVGDEQTS